MKKFFQKNLLAILALLSFSTVTLGASVTPANIFNKSGDKAVAIPGITQICKSDKTTCTVLGTGGASTVTSVFSRTGAVVATDGDYNQAKITGLKTTDSPTFAGVTATTFTGALAGNASTSTALASNPTDCGANTWADTIDASGNLTCSAVTYAGISSTTSANWATKVSDETGTGAWVFANSPTLVTPTLGVATGTSFNGVPLTSAGAGTNVLYDDGTYKASGGGGITWASSITGTGGTGLTTTIGNSASAGTIGQSIVIGNTQTQNLTALSIDVGVDAGVSSRAHKNIDLINRTTDGKALNVNAYDSATQILGTGGTRARGIYMGENFNTSSGYSYIHLGIVNEQNGGTGKNTGIVVENKSTEFATAAVNSGGGIEVYQSGLGGTAYSLYTAANINSSTNGLVNYTLNNTQSAASVMQKIDTGTSAQGHTGLLVNLFNASTSAKAFSAQFSTTGTGTAYQAIFSNLSGAGKFFSFDHNVSGTLTSNTTDKTLITMNRSHTAGTTITDDFKLLAVTRLNSINNADGIFNAGGSVVEFKNVATQTAGTLTDSVAVLKLTQDNDSTGGHILFNTYTGTPTTDGTFYFDGTNFKVRVGGTTYNLDMTAI